MFNKDREVVSRNLYVVYDVIMKESAPIFEAKNDGVAVRMLIQSSQKIPYAKDFKLFFVGTIDHVSNLITPHKPEEVLVADFIGDEDEK